MTDIIEFWSRIGRGDKIHPADKKALDRINPKKHGFSIECLPACYSGRLRSARMVLLYLSPGFSKQDLIDASTDEGKDYYLRRWKGNEPLPDFGRAGHAWLKSRTKRFGDYEVVRDKLAVLNIGAYHSKNVKSYSSLLALPSSRVSLAWAQDILFPEAEAGKRIVICMRSAAYWGLETGKTYGKSLVVPHITRSGHLTKSKDNERLVEKVRDFLEK